MLVSLLLQAAHLEGHRACPARSHKTSAMILLLIFGARYFSYFLTTSEIAPSHLQRPRQTRDSTSTWS